MFSSPPVCKSGLKPRNLQGFLWLSGQKPCKNRWFLKCLGFKNGRKIDQNLERFCRKLFFRRLEASKWHKQRYLHGFVCLPGTKPCKLRWFWAVYASKWPQNTVNTSVFMCFQLLLSSRVASNHAICRFFVAERAFAVLGGFKVAQSDGTYTGFCTFLPQNPVYWDGFKLCTLQSGHKTS